MNEANSTLAIEVAGIEKRAAVVSVGNNAERMAAVAFIQQVKEWRKRVQAYFAPTKQTAHETWKGIVAQESALTSRADKAEAQAKAAILVFDRAQEEIRRKEQARLQAEAEAKAAADREALLGRAAVAPKPEIRAALEAAAANVAPAQAVALPTVLKSGADSTRKTWKARVVDPFAVPRKFLVVDQRALDEFARATSGTIPVAGVEFFEQETLAIRG